MKKMTRLELDTRIAKLSRWDWIALSGLQRRHVGESCGGGIWHAGFACSREGIICQGKTLWSTNTKNWSDTF